MIVDRYSKHPELPMSDPWYREDRWYDADVNLFEMYAD